MFSSPPPPPPSRPHPPPLLSVLLFPPFSSLLSSPFSPYPFPAPLALPPSLPLSFHQLKKLMVVGIDSYHDSATRGRSVGGFIASTNQTLNRFVSAAHLNFKNEILKKNFFYYAVEAARKFNVNAVDCSSVLRVTCPCCFVCECVFCDSFLCCFYLILLLVS